MYYYYDAFNLFIRLTSGYNKLWLQNSIFQGDDDVVNGEL